MSFLNQSELSLEKLVLINKVIIDLYRMQERNFWD